MINFRDIVLRLLEEVGSGGDILEKFDATSPK